MLAVAGRQQRTRSTEVEKASREEIAGRLRIANHLAWAKVPTIWHGQKCQPFGMGKSANHLAWAKSADWHE